MFLKGACKQSYLSQILNKGKIGQRAFGTADLAKLSEVFDTTAKAEATSTNAHRHH